MEVIGSKAKRTAANAIAPHPNAVTFVPSSQNAEQDAETFRYRGGEFPVGETRSAFSSRKRCAYSRDNPAEAAAPPPTDNAATAPSLTQLSSLNASQTVLRLTFLQDYGNRPIARRNAPRAAITSAAPTPKAVAATAQ
jgi:hypothetical protein